MKKTKLVTTVTALLLIVGLIASTNYVVFNQRAEPFYVGVTYCGNSVQEAKELIDKVKDYTNLFVLQSGPFMSNTEVMEEIGDYAVASNLSYAVSGSTKNVGRGLNNEMLVSWLVEVKNRWGEQFIGIYYDDEPGGNMLDDRVNFQQTPLNPNGSLQMGGSTFSKDKGNSYIWFSNGTSYNYQANSEITVMTSLDTGHSSVTYYPNGTITATRHVFTTDDVLFYAYMAENITQYPLPLQSYDEVLNQYPIQTYDDAANLYVNHNKNTLAGIDKKQLEKQAISVFTSDYGLYWWDYKGNYDMILTQLGWNNSVTQEIGLVRGAANMQNKQWGTIITWKYTQPPYLTEGEEMFEQLQTSYKTGANYALIFNYSEDPANPNTLQEEHFQALERFWNEVVQNSEVTHGGIKAEAALVLPKNYGWGMRNPNDNIWGIWPADSTSQEIWSQLQDKIDQHGLQLDIVFEDSNQFVEGKYAHVYYWDQRMPVIVIVLVMLLIFSFITLAIIVYRRVNKKHKK